MMTYRFIFGGFNCGGNVTACAFTVFNFLGDLWAWNITAQTWVLVDSGATGPGPRAGMGLAAPGGTVLYVYGGQGANGVMQDMWTFDVGQRTWTAVSPTNLPGPRYAIMFVALSPARIMLVGGSSTDPLLYVYNVGAGWERVSTVTSPYSVCGTTALRGSGHAVRVTNGSGFVHLMSFGGFDQATNAPGRQVCLAHVGCHVGHAAVFADAPCTPCSTTSYAATIGQAACTPCPSGTRAATTGSTSPHNCSECDISCVYGSCAVVNMSPVCTCRALYFGPSCDQTSLVIFVSVLVPTCVAVAVAAYIASRLYRRQVIALQHGVALLDQSRRNLARARKVFTLDIDEFELHECLGAGAFCEVRFNNEFFFFISCIFALIVCILDM